MAIELDDEDSFSSHAFCCAAGRRLRRPVDRGSRQYRSDLGIAPPYLLAGGPEVRSEVARVLEVGYRGQVGQDLSYSVTAYRNLYDHQRTQDVVTMNGARTIVFGNLMEGQARGIEAWGSYQMSDAWRLSAGTTALHEKLGLKSGSKDAVSAATSALAPAWTAQLRLNYAFDSRRWDW